MVNKGIKNGSKKRSTMVVDSEHLTPKTCFCSVSTVGFCASLRSAECGWSCGSAYSTSARKACLLLRV